MIKTHKTSNNETKSKTIPNTRRVIIGTPSYDGKVDCFFMYSMIETVKLGLTLGVEIIPIQICHDALIQRARNDLIAIALESECDDLIFMDSDQEWEPSWIFKLLDYDVDVVGGVVPKKSDVPMFNVKALKTGINIDENGLMEVESVGTGFLRVSKKALKAVSEMSKEYKNEGKIRKMAFDIQIVDGELVSEDNVFCSKWRSLGNKVYIDPSMTCSHIGIKKWEGNFLAFLDALKKQDISKKAE